jgi:hypothetical protein
MNLFAPKATYWETPKGAIVAKRFVLRAITFIGLVIPAAFALALLAAPAQPAPLERPGCDRNLADAYATVTTLQARMKAAHGAEACAATRLYFLEVVKARAVTALCKSGPDRERELGRLDADVENINTTIGAHCG